MTSLVSAVEAIEKAMREAAVNLVDTLVLERETNGQSKEFSDWAVFMVMRAFKEQRADVARQAEALAERLKQEAQAHAMEARTANSTIYEIYQVVSGGKGEPGNWHGAEPVRAKVKELEQALDQMTTLKDIDAVKRSEYFDRMQDLERENANLRRIGGGMSNVLHHWKQQSSMRESDRRTMADLQEEWDAIPARALLGGSDAGN